MGTSRQGSRRRHPSPHLRGLLPPQLTPPPRLPSRAPRAAFYAPRNRKPPPTVPLCHWLPAASSPPLFSPCSHFRGAGRSCFRCRGCTRKRGGRFRCWAPPPPPRFRAEEGRRGERLEGGGGVKREEAALRAEPRRPRTGRQRPAPGVCGR